MHWQTGWLVTLLSVAGVALYVIALMVVVTVARDRMTPTVGGILGFCIGGGTWGIAAGYQLASQGPGKQRWFGISTAAFVVLVVGWYVATMAISDRRDLLTKRRIAPVVVVGGLLTAIAVTNGLHEWLLTGRLLRHDGLVVLAPDFAPIYLVTLAFATILTLAGGIALVAYARRKHRWGASLVFLGTIALPVATGTAYHLQVGPPINLTPIAVLPAAIALAYLVLDREELGRVPVPRSTVVARMTEGLLVVDSDGRIDDANPAARELLDIDDPVGRPVGTIIPEWPDSEASQTTEITVDDGRRYLRIRVTPLDAGNTMALIEDETDRRALEQRYRAIIEESAEVNLVLDEAGRVSYVSPSVEAVHGFDPEDLEGQGAFEYVAPDDRDRVREVFEEVLADPDGEARVEYAITDANGDRRVVESLVRNLTDHPHVGGVAVTSRDVTERKARERRLEEMNERLEAFASVLSHDLRNPLEVAEIHTTLARRGDDEALDTVEQAHDRMEAMIEDILTLVRDDRTLEIESVTFGDVVDDAWDQVHTGQATLEITEDGRLLADQVRLRRILVNLFRNAITHGVPDDGDPGDLTIRAHRTEEGFAIADDGRGIDPDNRDRVFENGFTTDEDGTGLGLAIVERNAEAHDWSVEVIESWAGGTRFEFTGVDHENSYHD
ncbi:MAG: PAS domain S-box protein [Halococcoides sp.]